MAFSILIARQIIPTAEIRDGPVLGFVRGEPKTFLGQPLSGPAAAKVAIPTKSVACRARRSGCVRALSA
jgi:hypothetical protein